MSPEFRRNLWLELSPRRMATAAIILALLFFATALTSTKDFSLILPLHELATWIYFGVVVLWGTRNAALSVVGEIRDRTWDAQRLSSLGAGEMTWGKLFGSTIYNWYVGGICLVVLLAQEIAYYGIVSALVDLVYFLEIGVIAQASAMLASLVAVRRRQSHSRAEVFIYQLAGLLAAIAVHLVWKTATAASIARGVTVSSFTIQWWGYGIDAQPFLLVSLALFTGWILTGCYREMRTELKMENGPFVWLGFLAFIGLYAAGFDSWLSQSPDTAGWGAVALRLGLAASTFATLTYAMVFLEPKDRVHFRWLGTQITTGRIDRALWGVQGFMMSYAALVLITAVLIWWRMGHGGGMGEVALIGAGLGFVTRDVALFALLHALPGRRRGDFTAVLALFALYLLIPSILNGLGLSGALVFFYPKPSDPVWLSPAFAWGEAALVIAAALGRIALSDKPKAEAAPA